jgi:hypothetical protein
LTPPEWESDGFLVGVVVLVDGVPGRLPVVFDLEELCPTTADSRATDAKSPKRTGGGGLLDELKVCKAEGAPILDAEDADNVLVNRLVEADVSGVLVDVVVATDDTPPDAVDEDDRISPTLGVPVLFTDSAIFPRFSDTDLVSEVGSSVSVCRIPIPR